MDLLSFAPAEFVSVVTGVDDVVERTEKDVTKADLRVLGELPLEELPLELG